MKQAIVPGGSIEAATPAEVRELVRAELRDKTASTIRTAEQRKADANGNVAIDVYEVPPGMEFELTRLLVTADGVTPGVPFVGPLGSWGTVRRSDELIDYWTGEQGVASGKLQVPVRLSYSGRSAPRIRNGEVLQVTIEGSPGGVLANAAVTVRLQGFLLALPDE